MNNQYKRLLKLTLWSAVIIFTLRCAIGWNSIITNFSLSTLIVLFRYAGNAVTIAVLISIIYERWGWRWIPFEKHPKLKKEYRGIFKSTYDGKVRDATLKIKQTYLSVSVTIYTKESKSNSVSASIIDMFGDTQRIYAYHNIPKSEYRYRSDIHFGTAMLCVNDPMHLTGEYFTDRKTSGDMTFDAT